MKLICVASGGALGSLLRFSTMKIIERSKTLPSEYSSLIINLSGSFLIGIVAYFFLKTVQQENLKLFVMAGFLGGFTTFSAFALENFQLIKLQNYKGFLLNMGIQNLGGIILVFLGFWIAEFLFSSPR